MRESTLRVSVVIPVYNEERYLGACLDSLMKQSIKADEIIIVDNNSTDNTVEIAQKYPVKIIHEKKQGIIPTRNYGFNEAKYEIIARTDADTILPPTWIKRIKKTFLDEQLVGISGPASFYDLPTIFKRTWQSKTASIKFIQSYNTIVRQLLRHDCLFGPNFAIRQIAWNMIKNSVCLDDSKVHEDLDLAIHLAPIGKIKFMKTFTVSTSVRRWKRPEAYIEYLYRGLKSIQRHKQLAVKQRSKQFVKKMVEKALFLD
ncbi:MAG TPA: glycosyltransferase family A protein [Candidatus Sulfotelmatobacter sp.]|jgi:glycosyltransferase involved in cell wall biosynthesis|nr:glycosyltransferase family A protein [Candidatus Sulfotelmatobacter sp.]